MYKWAQAGAAFAQCWIIKFEAASVSLPPYNDGKNVLLNAAIQLDVSCMNFVMHKHLWQHSMSHT